MSAALLTWVVKAWVALAVAWVVVSLEDEEERVVVKVGAGVALGHHWVVAAGAGAGVVEALRTVL